MSIRIFIVVNAWVMLTASPIFAQPGSCETAIPPFSVNGVIVNHDFNENVMVRHDNPNSPVCLGSGISPPPPHVYLGVWEPPIGSIINPFSYNLYFSKPVTYFDFFLTNGHLFLFNGDTLSENFVFDAYGCSFELDEIFSCDASIEDNTIYLSGFSFGGCGHFTIEFTEPVFMVTISGLGGGAGSLLNLCSNSITPAPFWAGMSAPGYACGQDSVLFTAYIGGEEIHPPPYTFTYTLNGGAPETISTAGTNESVSLAIPTTPGIYTYELLSVTDGNAATVNITCNNSVTVEVQAAPIAQFTASPGSGFAPLNVTLQNQSSHATNYAWYVNPSGGFDSAQPPTSTAENPVLTLNETGVYEITLVAFNDLGCSDTTVQTVHVLEQLQVVIPNVFTPNNDGINDWFGITSNVEANASIVILNRWGNVVFEKEFEMEANTFMELWDGRGVVDGVYFYRLRVGEEEFSGFVHLKK